MTPKQLARFASGLELIDNRALAQSHAALRLETTSQTQADIVNEDNRVVGNIEFHPDENLWSAAVTFRGKGPFPLKVQELTPSNDLVVKEQHELKEIARLLIGRL